MEKAKTVGIITFHAAYNYGAMLQAYALQQVVNSMGFESEIINFRSSAQKKLYGYNFKTKGLEEKVKFLFHIGKYFSYIKRANQFEKFLKNDLRITNQEYNSFDDLRNSNLNYDIYISGSDQIWNTNLEDFSETFFLKFVNKGRKISYAASMGNSLPLYSAGKYPEYINYLSEYDHISVREFESEILLRKLTEKDVFTALDPTLLLEKIIWDKLAGDSPLFNNNYVLGYSPVRRNEELLTYLNEISIRNSIKAISPCSFQFYSDKRTWSNITCKSIIGPREFLNYIKFADFVVCQSFHAVVFSLIFGKPFICLNMYEDRRINQILAYCGLMHLIISPETSLTLNIKEYKPNNIEPLIPFINNSLIWLKEALVS